MRGLGRACAAVSLAGWVFIAPPIRQQADRMDVDLDAPEAIWIHVSTHDTLAQCEDARTAIREDAKRQNLNVPVIVRRQTQARVAGAPPNPALAKLLALQLGRCVPAAQVAPPSPSSPAAPAHPSGPP